MVSKEIIDSIRKKYTRGGKEAANKVQEYISKNEPDFKKYLDTSTWEDIKHLIESLGIPPAKELMDALSRIIIGGKIEGFLIHSISQDQFWAHKYGIDINGDLKPEDRFKLFLEGKANPSNYKYKLTEKEKLDPKNYKKIALENFTKNQEKITLENTLNNTQHVTNEIKDKKKITHGDLLD